LFKWNWNHSINIFSVVFFILAVLFLIILFSSTELIVNFLWFKELGYTKVFLTRYITEIEIGLIIFVALFILLFVYFSRAKEDFKKYSGDILSPQHIKQYNIAIFASSFVIAFLMAFIYAQKMWSHYLSFINSQNFGIKDPIFNYDVGLYIFRLPFIRDVYSLLIVVLFGIGILTILLYGLMFLSEKTMIYRVDSENVFKAIYNREILAIALRKIAVIGLLFFIILAFGYYLSSFDLLYSPRGVAFGASYTDVHVDLLFKRILSVASIALGVVFYMGATKKNIRMALLIPVVTIAVLTILSNVSASLVQSFVVAPNEIAKEEQYLRYNIDFTKMAYNLNNLEEKEFPADKELSIQDIQNNRQTVDNIRVNDYRPVKEVYDQLQGIRLYYAFNDIDIDRYFINGRYTQVFLAAREMQQKNLPSQAQTWINKHLKYTHGYGVVMSSVNSVTSEGFPNLLIKDIPPVSNIGIQVNRPEIYFGELTNDYVIVNTKQMEFDYPQGDNNKESVYQGKAGIPLNLATRILFTIKTGDLKILLSNDITSGSRILINRNILQRVDKIAPFLLYDNDPYIVVDGGKLYWIIDAYTYTRAFPYSEPDGLGLNLNYIRNSVKVVVDAYNGDVTFYVSDKKDPIISVYRKIFPDLFKELDKMPEGLRAHLRYPQLIFDVQANILKNYHMTNPQIFYNREDAWDIAKEKYSGKVQEMESQYIVMKIPGEQKEEFILMVPYTPVKKDNMVSWLAARMDGENYGKLILFKFPKNRLIYGPMQIESRIDQDPNISKELTLWDQKGSSVIRGNLLVIPIDSSVLYVQPLYIKSQNEKSLPEVKRVIVAYGDRIVMEETLEKAISKLFNISMQNMTPPSGTQAQEGTQDVKGLIEAANDLYNKANQSIQNGDWASYGSYIKQLGDVLKKLKDTAQ